MPNGSEPKDPSEKYVKAVMTFVLALQAVLLAFIVWAMHMHRDTRGFVSAAIVLVVWQLLELGFKKWRQWRSRNS